MSGEGYKSRIDRLKKRLYSKKRSISHVPTTSFSFRKRNFNVRSDWNENSGATNVSKGGANDENNNVPNDYDQTIMKKKKTSILNKLLLGAISLLLVSGIFAYISITNNGNNFSSDNIEITLSGPISINAGDILSFEINILNKNDVDLETTDLLIEYPEGTRDSDNIKNTINRYRKSLGVIKSGESKQEVVEVALFGSEGSIKDIIIGVEYRVPDSNAIFFTERKYEVKISSSPISVNVSAPKEVNSGQEIEFVIDVRSNSEKDLENIIIQTEYPFGFSFLRSTPEIIARDLIWRVPVLKKGENKQIVLVGKIEGQDNEERVFRFNVGLEDEKIEDKIGVNFVTHTKLVSIKKPFVSMDVLINGSTKTDQVIAGGEDIRTDISWKNNLPTRISDGVLKVKINGDILDKSSVVSNGFYNSSDNTIIWDKRNNNELGIINESEQGTVNFGFSIKPLSSLINSNIENPEILLEFSFVGNRLDVSSQDNENLNIPDNIIYSISKKIKISSEISISSKVSHFDSIFINTGPIPPKVGAETTYSVTLSVSNLINDISGATIKAVLPTYVRWMGVYSPKSEEISYNPVGGEIKWDIGEISSGAGYVNPSKELQFQIALTPSLSQVGKAVNLLENIEFSGLDVFTDSVIKKEIKDLNTYFSLDSSFSSEMGNVVK